MNIRQQSRRSIYYFLITGVLLICLMPTSPKLYMFYGVDNSITWKINTSILLGPDEYGLHGCPPHCGCPENPSDCPRWYSLDSVKESAVASDLYVLDNQRKKLEHARRRAKTLCEVNEGVVGLTGGWCLKPQNNGKSIEFPNGVAYELAQFHTKPSTRIVKELVNLFLAENVTTVNDFGAGIAQYKAAITRALPLIHYDAYDGAGNGEEYTKGMMSFVDLTLALDLPVAEWMISLEVGEHIPSKYEGMFIRNLHRHNKKGVVLSWAVLGQGGHSHVNNHSNEYVIQLFEGLGYTYDDGLTKKLRLPTQNRQWFTNSVFVFRRTGFEM